MPARRGGRGGVVHGRGDRRDDAGDVDRALAAAGLDRGEQGADAVDHLQQHARAGRGQLQLAVPQPGEHVLPDVRDLLEPVEGQEAAGALDGVDRPEDAGQPLAGVGVLLEGDQVGVQLVEVLVTLDQELLDDVVQTVHACCLLSHVASGLRNRPVGSSARRRRSQGRTPPAAAVSRRYRHPRRRTGPPEGTGSVREGGDGRAQVGRHAGQLVHGGAGLGERLRGGLRGRGDAGDVAGDLRGAAGRLLHRPRHLVGGRGLLLHRAGDGGLPVGDLRDDRGDLLDRRDRRRGVALDREHPAGDVLGRLRRLLRQLLDLVGDDGEALARLAGPRRLDGGVQREQVGLLGDARDDLDDVADLGRGLAQLGDGGGRGLGGGHGAGGDLAGLGGVRGDLADRGTHLLRAGGDGGHAARDLLRGGGHDAGLRAGLLGRRRDLRGGGAQLLRGGGDGVGRGGHTGQHLAQALDRGVQGRAHPAELVLGAQAAALGQVAGRRAPRPTSCTRPTPRAIPRATARPMPSARAMPTTSATMDKVRCDSYVAPGPSAADAAASSRSMPVSVWSAVSAWPARSATSALLAANQPAVVAGEGEGHELVLDRRQVRVVGVVRLLDAARCSSRRAGGAVGVDSGLPRGLQVGELVHDGLLALGRGLEDRVAGREPRAWRRRRHGRTWP